MKKIICVLLSLCFVLSCFASCKKEVPNVSVAVLSGPTGVGAVNLWNNAENGNTKLNYSFSLSAGNDQIIANDVSGKADIAAVATNMAAALWNKTNGKITLLAVNTGSVLNILSKTKINSFSELKGKEIYLTGEGATPEYALKYLLKSNGINPEADVKLNFVEEGSALTAVWAKKESENAVILAPEPVATAILTKYKNAVRCFNLGEEWEKRGGGSELLMGGIIVNNDFLKNNKEAVKTFLTEYRESIEKAKTDIPGTAKLMAEKGIAANEKIAEKSLPNMALMYLDGNEMKEKLSGYFEVLYNANPKSIGGKLPANDFYY